MLRYEDLGVVPVINALGTVTKIGGSTIPEPVMDSMMEASRHFVQIHELQEAASNYISRRLGVESALITSGASAGMTLAAAAVIAGMDPELRVQLPDTTGLRNEIIVFCQMRTKYDQAFRVAGARLVEVDGLLLESVQDLKNHVTASTSAVAYILEHEDQLQIPFEHLLEVAHQLDLEVIVDAAAELPPVENLWKYSRQGADMTIFSGGKDIRGPQSTGLIVGRKELIEACAFHACPNHALGRGMKVGKEEIMGLLTALDIYLVQDFDKEMSNWEEQVAYIVETLSSINGVKARRVFPDEPGIQPTCIPRAYVNWASKVTSRSAQEVGEFLLDGYPRVVAGVLGNNLVINPQMLEKGQEQIVAECIKSALKND